MLDCLLEVRIRIAGHGNYPAALSVITLYPAHVQCMFPLFVSQGNPTSFLLPPLQLLVLQVTAYGAPIQQGWGGGEDSTSLPRSKARYLCVAPGSCPHLCRPPALYGWFRFCWWVGHRRLLSVKMLLPSLTGVRMRSLIHKKIKDFFQIPLDTHNNSVYNKASLGADTIAPERRQP